MIVRQLEVTWLGHAAFLLLTPGGKRVLIDPWVMSNPVCPTAYQEIKSVDLLLVTHGHFDHIGDAVSIARQTQAPIVSVFETSLWLSRKGVDNAVGMNKGGTLSIQGIQVKMVDAKHSCGIQDGEEIIYGGEAAGFILTLEDGLKLYHAGDTALFEDMALYGERYRPDIVCLPIGDRYTMGHGDAAYAVELIKPRWVIPMHHGTFDALPGSPGEFAKLVGSRAEVVILSPGQTRAFSPAFGGVR
ncbi:MAG: metal-dependent hydrolase [Cyanobacteria bacterium NC_groundwater_1444_Ag_S-0.65um_54_12]|nr:metal-dependent hydrolase [Cyanobacteria bacterium NC_groundwater_1444_Ag_S-0.65um_54_12]